MICTPNLEPVPQLNLCWGSVIVAPRPTCPPHLLPTTGVVYQLVCSHSFGRTPVTMVTALMPVIFDHHLGGGLLFIIRYAIATLAPLLGLERQFAQTLCVYIISYLVSIIILHPLPLFCPALCMSVPCDP